MKICGGAVAINKLAFANSYRTVVDQKPQFPPVLRSGNMCVNCGVSPGECSLFFLLVTTLSVHAHVPCKHCGSKEKYLSVLPPTPEKQHFLRELTPWQQGEVFIRAPSNPRETTFSKGASPPQESRFGN